MDDDWVCEFVARVCRNSDIACVPDVVGWASLLAPVRRAGGGRRGEAMDGQGGGAEPSQSSWRASFLAVSPRASSEPSRPNA